MPIAPTPRPSGEAHFALAPGARPEALVERLASRFRVQRLPASEGREVLFDTPDWRLYRSRMTLAERGEGPAAELVLERSGARALCCPANGRAAFAWELPAGPLGESVGRVTAARRLLPQVELHVRRTPLLVLDGRDKTVVRVHLVERRAALPGGEQRELATAVSVEPLRGYDLERARVVEFLAALAAEGELAPAEAPGLGPALRALDRDPDAKRLAWQVELGPREPAGRALRRVLARYHAILSADVPGLLADVDTEFTHDVRIAIRRTRSILRQAKRVLARAPLEHFRAEFAWIARGSSRLRDLDVLLLAIHVPRGDRHGRLGGAPPADLGALAARLADERRAAHERLALDLGSPRWLELAEAWPRFLAAPAPDDPPGAEEPVRAFAARRIRRQHKRVIERGAALGEESSAADFHALRIECKELRYLVDAFGGLFPVQPVARLLKQQKGLQAALGELNDAWVQRELLEQSAGALAAPLAAPGPAALIAVGRAIESLAARAERLRPEALESLQAFLGADQRALLAGFSAEAEG